MTYTRRLFISRKWTKKRSSKLYHYINFKIYTQDLRNVLCSQYTFGPYTVVLALFSKPISYGSSFRCLWTGSSLFGKQNGHVQNSDQRDPALQSTETDIAITECDTEPIKSQPCCDSYLSLRKEHQIFTTFLACCKKFCCRPNERPVKQIAELAGSPEPGRGQLTRYYHQGK